jgi:hypothetical protein
MADFSGIETVFKVFKETAEAAANAEALNGVGMQLLAAILALLFVYQTIITLVEGSSGRKLMAECINLIMLGSIAAFLISPAGAPKITNVLIESADQIATKINPGLSTGSDGKVDGFQTAMAPLFLMMDAAVAIWDSDRPKTVADDQKSVWTKMADAVIDAWSFSILFWVVQALLKLCAVVIIILAAGIAMCQVISSQLLIHIAVLLAPLFIPFMVWERASFLFDGWLRFFIKSVFHKIIGLVMMGLLSKTVSASLKVTQDSLASDAFNSQWMRITALMGVIILVIVLAYMMWQIGSIADGLISGSASAGARLGSLPRKTPTPKEGKTKGASGSTGGGGSGGSGGGAGGGGGGGGGGAGPSGSGGGASSPPPSSGGLGTTSTSSSSFGAKK